MSARDVRPPYIFAGVVDTPRLDLQNDLFGTYIRAHAQRLLPAPIHRILDLGCGNGQLGRIFLDLYPQAELVGIDRDPAAITAAHQAVTQVSARATYIIGDIEEQLPPGPFDLIYASVVLAHTRQPAHTLQLAWQALRPGGILWVKDLIFRTNTKFSPAFQRLAQLLADSIAALGGQPDVIGALPGLLDTAGFTALQQEIEEYPLGGSTPTGQITAAICLTAFQNARPMILRTQAITADMLTILYDAALVDAQGGAGVLPGINILAQRPDERDTRTHANL